ncbi:hypothetical protein K505DRAFT_342820, partial [Melanomma pulvis-pyrius CBS 109.77]
MGDDFLVWLGLCAAALLVGGLVADELLPVASAGLVHAGERVFHASRSAYLFLVLVDHTIKAILERVAAILFAEGQGPPSPPPSPSPSPPSSPPVSAAVLAALSRTPPLPPPAQEAPVRRSVLSTIDAISAHESLPIWQWGSPMEPHTAFPQWAPRRYRAARVPQKALPTLSRAQT